MADARTHTSNVHPCRVVVSCIQVQLHYRPDLAVAVYSDTLPSAEGRMQVAFFVNVS